MSVSAFYYIFKDIDLNTLLPTKFSDIFEGFFIDVQTITLDDKYSPFDGFSFEHFGDVEEDIKNVEKTITFFKDILKEFNLNETSTIKEFYDKLQHLDLGYFDDRKFLLEAALHSLVHPQLIKVTTLKNLGLENFDDMTYHSFHVDRFYYDKAGELYFEKWHKKFPNIFDSYWSTESPLVRYDCDTKQLTISSLDPNLVIDGFKMLQNSDLKEIYKDMPNVEEKDIPIFKENIDRWVLLLDYCVKNNYKLTWLQC